MEISPYTGRPMTPVDAPRAPGQRDGYTSEGDIENADIQAMNEDIDVPASRARFGRRTPKPLAELATEAVAANDGLPLNVVTKSTAETLAVLNAVTATTAHGARIMREFDSANARANAGTIVIGGRHDAPAARKLLRDGLIERVRDTNVIYRATAVGRAWLAAQV